MPSDNDTPDLRSRKDKLFALATSVTDLEPPGRRTQLGKVPDHDGVVFPADTGLTMTQRYSKFADFVEAHPSDIPAAMSVLPTEAQIRDSVMQCKFAPKLLDLWKGYNEIRSAATAKGLMADLLATEKAGRPALGDTKFASGLSFWHENGDLFECIMDWALVRVSQSGSNAIPQVRHTS